MFAAKWCKRLNELAINRNWFCRICTIVSDIFCAASSSIPLVFSAQPCGIMPYLLCMKNVNLFYLLYLLHKKPYSLSINFLNTLMGKMLALYFKAMKNV